MQQARVLKSENSPLTRFTLIEQKLTELAAMRKGLAALVSKCGKGGKHPFPIIQMLVTDLEIL